MAVEPANLIEIKTVTYNQPANLALIPIGDVSYRQCGNSIQPYCCSCLDFFYYYFFSFYLLSTLTH